MYPTLGPELPDARVYEGEARLGLLEEGQVLVVLVPGHVDADGVALHLAVERVVGGHAVEELPPDELADNCVGVTFVAVHLPVVILVQQREDDINGCRENRKLHKCWKRKIKLKSMLEEPTENYISVK